MAGDAYRRTRLTSFLEACVAALAGVVETMKPAARRPVSNTRAGTQCHACFLTEPFWRKDDCHDARANERSVMLPGPNTDYAIRFWPRATSAYPCATVASISTSRPWIMIRCICRRVERTSRNWRSGRWPSSCPRSRRRAMTSVDGSSNLPAISGSVGGYAISLSWILTRSAATETGRGCIRPWPIARRWPGRPTASTSI